MVTKQASAAAVLYEIVWQEQINKNTVISFSVDNSLTNWVTQSGKLGDPIWTQPPVDCLIDKQRNTVFTVCKI